jgi:RimJ/RimL family protein N-acetyltransferase
VWFGHQTQGQLDAVALLYVGMPTPTLLALSRGGDALPALVRSIADLLPARFYAHLTPGIASVLEPTYRLTAHGLHLKMSLAAAEGRPGHGPATAPADARTRRSVAYPADPSRLTSDDLPALLALYEASYPGNWFDPRMVETGQYFGIRDGSRLVSVAGIHVFSPRYGVAALGNVATLPSHRGRGLAARVTERLCRSLTAEGLLVGLNVSADNEAAIACYRGVGFETVAVYEEFEVERAR